jgi:guanylate cyclase soluble subunit beta
MGVHSGGCVAGVVGTKIPHYSIFGESVEIAGLMEASGEPMKIQVSRRMYKGSVI